MDKAPYPVHGLIRRAAGVLLAATVGSLTISVLVTTGADLGQDQIWNRAWSVGGSPVTDTRGAAGTPLVVDITLDEMSISPSDLVIPASQNVTLRLHNRGLLLHDFSSAELRISPDARPGATVEFELNAAPGVYEIYCSIPGHRAAGMVATMHAAPPGTPESG